MVPETVLSPLDPSRYTWHQSAQYSSIWQRLALSNECTWAARPKELHELFICSSLTLTPPIPRATLDSAAARAWQILRYQVPELALTASIAADGARAGTVYLQYRTPQSRDEVDAWIDRTSHYEAGSDVLSFNDLRAKVLAAKQGHNSDQAFVLLHSQTRDDSHRLVEILQIMLNIDHQVADGTGTKILLGKYLSLLASVLMKPDELLPDELQWKESYKNLSAPWIQHMNEDQAISGLEYEDTIKQNQGMIHEKVRSNPGLPFSQNTYSSSQETHSITISTPQTSAILKSIKKELSPSSNITHLCHAAIVLALLRASPPLLTSYPTQNKTLYSPCWLNGRRYLSPTTACPNPISNYILICLSFAPIIFTDLEKLVLFSTTTQAETRERLLKACCISTEQYSKIRGRRSMLPECVNLFENIGRSMSVKKSTNLANVESKDHADQTAQQTAEPFFLSDGLTEQYISHTYPFSQISPTFTVNDVHFAAYAEQNLIVRMSSWRGSTTVSGEWRGCNYDYGTIVRFLEDVVRIMGLIVGSEKR